MDRILLEKFQARAETLMRSYYEALLKGRDEFRADFPDLAVEVLWSGTGIDIRLGLLGETCG